MEEGEGWKGDVVVMWWIYLFQERDVEVLGWIYLFQERDVEVLGWIYIFQEGGCGGYGVDLPFPGE